ncbi:hypothetical protein SY88_22700 [Clostridiales bacterium PH28_bin88]|nr:hypothetical protein SY88_22700 [Clostridiales bacterium PH28_bin88]
MMDQKQQIQQCIKDCQQVITDLQSVSNRAQDQKMKATLNESVHHLEMCMRECEFASKQAP